MSLPTAPDDHRQAYAQRMHRVQVHIDNHLAQSLRLSELASVANLSVFHFHRLFLAWVGETPADYIRRRRLEAAAMRLVAQPRLPLLDVALSVGFGSAEAFSRAFKVRYGVAPTPWRRASNHSIGSASNAKNHHSKMDHAGIESLLENAGMLHLETFMSEPVRMVDLPCTELVGLAHQGPYGDAIEHFWRNAALPWFFKAGLINRQLYGISRDDSDITDGERQRYEACVPLYDNEKHREIEAPAFRMTLAGGKHAMLSFKGTSQQIQVAWTYLLRDWLPSTGFQLDERPCFERYAVSAPQEAAAGVVRAELYMPVAKMSAVS
jgi:AraC family transcriptional regulator